MTDSLPEAISRYRIVDRLGVGGMGVVYRAHDEQLGRDLALKVLPAETMADENARARLVREARTASSLNHPHIAHIYEVGEDHGHLFIAMELVEGRSLRELIPAAGMGSNALLHQATQIADALGYAHRHGVIHRDLKSENVMVTPEGWIKVLDFGLAKRVRGAGNQEPPPDLKLTASGMMMGTPVCLPPEVIRGAEADARGDVWAMGVVLYQMATGKLPFSGSSMMALVNAILNAEPDAIAAGVSADLGKVIERCLAKAPGERYRDGVEVHAALEALVNPTAPLVAAKPARRLPRVAALLGLVAVIGVGAFALLRRDAVHENRTRLESLAVLPLSNLSGDASQEYLADGMTEELITDLASIRLLKVISRTSVMRFKGSKKPLGQIARELGVEGIVEGSVLRVGDRVRITAQLIEAASDRHLWARSYERDFSDVLTLQSEVARDIAQEIQLQLSVQETQRLAQRRPVQPEAYDLYLKGRYEWGKVTPEGNQKGIEYFEKALALDPGDARFSSGIADAYLVQVQVLGTLTNQEGMPKVKDYARRALAADEGSAEAHASMGAALFFGGWNYAEAEQHLKRSVELNPGYATSHLIYAVLLATAGRLGEAIEQDRIAQALDPLSLIIHWNATNTLFLARRYEDALAQAKKTLQIDPTSMLGRSAPLRIYEQQGNYVAAIDLMERFFPEMEGGKAVVEKVRKGYAAAGPAGYWRAVLENTLPHGQDGSHAVQLAMIYSRLGEPDRAIECLERGFAQHTADILFINVEPCFDALRGDARFQSIVRRAGLIPRA